MHLCTCTTGGPPSNLLYPSQDLTYTHHPAACTLPSLNCKLLSPSADMSSLNPSSPIWQVQLARMLIPHTLTSRSHVSLAVLIPQKSLSQKSKHCLWQQPHIFLSSLRMNPLLPEPFPSSIGRRRKPPLPSLLCTLDCSRSPLGVLLMHTWMSKSLKATWALSASMQHSESKLQPRTNLWQQFWLAGGCFHLLQKNSLRTLLPAASSWH